MKRPIEELKWWELVPLALLFLLYALLVAFFLFVVVSFFLFLWAPTSS